MKSRLCTLAVVVSLALVAAYGVMVLRGPRGLAALYDKQGEIRRLQEENTDLLREIEYKKRRIERLKGNPAEQEIEIRQKMKLVRPGDTVFVLPQRPSQ